MLQSICLGLALLAAPQAPATVTVGPSALTFPQLAKALSTDGRTVECPPALANRGAFVRLKGRPWAEAVRILEAGLEVRFVRKSADEDRWTFQRDPKVAARERDFQRRFLGALRDEIHRKLAASPAQDAAFPDVYRRYEEATARAREARASEPPGTPANASVARRLFDQARIVSITTSPGHWLSVRLLDRGLTSDLTYLLKMDHPLTPVNLGRAGDRESLAAVWALLSTGGLGEYRLEPLLRAHPAPPDLTAHLSLSLDKSRFGLTVYTALSGGGRVLVQSGVSASIGWINVDSLFRGSRVEETNQDYKGMGPEAVKWLDAERKKTEALLASETGKAPFTIEGARPVESLSLILEAWARKTGRDAVMELDPLREDLRLMFGVHTVSLGPGAETSLSQILKPQGCWTLRDQDGALIALNQLAFIDRTGEYPLAQFLALERRLGGRGEMQTSADIPLEDLLSYVRTVSVPQNRAWREIRAYRGIPAASLVSSYPVLSHIAGLKDAERKQLLTQVTAGEEYVVHLSQLPARELRDLMDAYVASFGIYEAGFALRPDLPEMFRSCTLRFSKVPSRADEPARLGVQVRPDRPMEQWAEFGPLGPYEATPFARLPDGSK